MVVVLNIQHVILINITTPNTVHWPCVDMRNSLLGNVDEVHGGHGEGVDVGVG